MNAEFVMERLFQALTAGDRTAARDVVQAARTEGASPEQLAHEVFWPTLEMIGKLYRADQLTVLAHHYATRLLRSVIDSVQVDYRQKASTGRRVVMFSGDSDVDELTGLLVADLIEADGYEVYFGGGGVANDEVLGAVGDHRPDILLMFASGPADAPNIRVLIDKIRDVNACPEMQIAVGGGVFNRASGLAEEIGADLWATSPSELLERLRAEPERRATPEQRTVGRNRRLPTRAAA